MLPLRTRVDLGAISTKGYSTFPKSPIQEPQLQMALCHIQDTRCGGKKSYLSAEIQLAYSAAPADWIAFSGAALNLLKDLRINTSL